MKRSSFKQKKTTPMKRTPLRAKTPLRGSTKPKVKSKKKKAPKTQAQLKKDLDAIFSKYIRAKYLKECYTCRKTEVTLQNGHFVSRQYLATRWDEDNCRPQCVGCNIFGNGKPLDFEERLKHDLGDEHVEKMKFSRHTMVKLNKKWYEEQIAIYKEKVKELT
jgi:hypothetical protein